MLASLLACSHISVGEFGGFEFLYIIVLCLIFSFWKVWLPKTRVSDSHCGWLSWETGIGVVGNKLLLASAV